MGITVTCLRAHISEAANPGFLSAPLTASNPFAPSCNPRGRQGSRPQDSTMKGQLLGAQSPVGKTDNRHVTNTQTHAVKGKIIRE